MFPVVECHCGGIIMTSHWRDIICSPGLSVCYSSHFSYGMNYRANISRNDQHCVPPPPIPSKDSPLPTYSSFPH